MCVLVCMRNLICPFCVAILQRVARIALHYVVALLPDAAESCEWREANYFDVADCAIARCIGGSEGGGGEILCSRRWLVIGKS